MATKCASRESCRSVSMNAAPKETALRKAAIVFSGAYPDAPRCAMTNTTPPQPQPDRCTELRLMETFSLCKHPPAVLQCSLPPGMRSLMNRTNGNSPKETFHVEEPN